MTVETILPNSSAMYMTEVSSAACDKEGAPIASKFCDVHEVIMSLKFCMFETFYRLKRE